MVKFLPEKYFFFKAETTLKTISGKCLLVILLILSLNKPGKAISPTIAASAAVFSHIGCNSIQLSWTNGNGTRRIVVVYPGAVTLPVNATTYTHNFDYASGGALGTGHVVYDSTGNSVTIIGLSASTSYTFAVFEYDAGPNYLTTAPPNPPYLSVVKSTTACVDYPFMSMTFTDGCTSTACGGTAYEGEDEFMLINSCSYGWNVSAAWGAGFDLDYGQYGPPVSSNHNYTSSTSFPAATATLNSATCGCAAGDFIDASDGGIAIPAWSTILLCSHPNSQSYCPNSYNFGGICSPTNPIYIIFANGGASTGSWSDNSSCGTNGNRYFTLNFTFLGGTNFEEYYQYDPCSENPADGSYEIFNYPPVTANSYVNAETPSTYGNTPGCSITTTMLPIALLSFTAQYDLSKRNVNINWSTASEVNNKYFTIKKTRDGVNWVTVAVVAGAGNSDHPINYSSTDESPFANVSYYRLEQTDYNGHSIYFNTVPVNVDPLANIMALAPNPATGITSVSFNCISNGSAQLTVSDLAGRVIGSKQISVVKGDNISSLDVSNYTNGLYFINISTDAQQLSAKLVVNHN